MKKIFSLMVFILSFYTSFPQVESADAFKRVAPGYYQEFLNFNSEKEGMTRLDVFIQVPYSFMQFVKVTGGFSASFMVTISIFDKERNDLVVEKSWNEKVETADFDITNSRNSFNLSLRSFELNPDDYIIRSEVLDKESKKSFSLEVPFKIRDMSSKPVISDIMLIAKQNVVDGNKKIVPNVSKNVTAQKEGIPIFYEITSRRPLEVSILYSITDNDNNTIIENNETRQIDTGKTQIFYTIQIEDLSLGNYNVNVKVLNEGRKEIASISKKFFSKWAGVPTSVTDLDKAIDQLRYIASTSEIENIEDGETKNEKIQRYVDFWKTKDPVPTTEENEVFEEYYRRIDYANQNFSHYTEGWKTDRGMVFITLGTPSNVERHPFDYDSKPYEVWQYYDLNRSFIFVDQTGFGDYRLITPMHGDDYRYR